MSVPPPGLAPRTFATDPRGQFRLNRRVYLIVALGVLLTGSGFLVSFLMRDLPVPGLMIMGLAAVIAASALVTWASLGRKANEVPDEVHVSPQHIAVDDHSFRWEAIRRVMLKGPGRTNHLYIQVDTHDGQTFRRPLGIDSIAGTFREYDEFVTLLHGIGALHGGIVVLDHS